MACFKWSAATAHHSVLKVGALAFAWKYDVPTFLTFLFGEPDFVANYNEDEAGYDEIGYATTCGRGLDLLSRYGFTSEFCGGIIDAFQDDLAGQYRDMIEDRLTEQSEEVLPNDELGKRVEAHLRRFPSTTRVQDIQNFVEFLRAPIASASQESQDVQDQSFPWWRRRSDLEVDPTDFDSHGHEQSPLRFGAALNDRAVAVKRTEQASPVYLGTLGSASRRRNKGCACSDRNECIGFLVWGFC